MAKLDREAIARQVADRLRDMDAARLARALRWLKDHELVRLDQITAEAMEAA